MSTKIKVATLAIALAIITPDRAAFADIQPEVCAKVQTADGRLDSRSEQAEERAKKVISGLAKKLNRLIARNEAKNVQIHSRANAGSCPAKQTYVQTLFSPGQCNIQ